MCREFIRLFYHARMKSMATRLLLLIAALASGPASAQATRWYAGLSVGESRTGAELVRNRESTVTLASDFHTDFDSRDSAAKATFGYRFLPWLAIEVDYSDLGRHSLVSSFLAGDPLAPAQVHLERRIRGFGADAVFTYPLAPQWKLLGRVGAFHAELDARQTLDGNVVFTNGDPSERTRSASTSETVLRYGAGMQFELTDCTWLRLEWTRHEKIGKAFAVGGTGTTGEADTDSVLVGLAYRF
jgi:opacity protein-like surface antigen